MRCSAYGWCKCRHAGREKTLECWRCGRNVDDITERYFCECGVVQPPVTRRSYFDIMGIEETFDVDPAELAAKYRSLQRILHPDKYSQKCDVRTPRVCRLNKYIVQNVVFHPPEITNNCVPKNVIQISDLHRNLVQLLKGI